MQTTPRTHSFFPPLHSEVVSRIISVLSHHPLVLAEELLYRRMLRKLPSQISDSVRVAHIQSRQQGDHPRQPARLQLRDLAATLHRSSSHRPSSRNPHRPRAAWHRGARWRSRGARWSSRGVGSSSCGRRLKAPRIPQGFRFGLKGSGLGV